VRLQQFSQRRRGEAGIGGGEGVGVRYVWQGRAARWIRAGRVLTCWLCVSRRKGGSQDRHSASCAERKRGPSVAAHARLSNFRTDCGRSGSVDRSREDQPFAVVVRGSGRTLVIQHRPEPCRESRPGPLYLSANKFALMHALHCVSITLFSFRPGVAEEQAEHRAHAL
jgi:hypothetical protein